MLVSLNYASGSFQRASAGEDIQGVGDLEEMHGPTVILALVVSGLVDVYEFGFFFDAQILSLFALVSRHGAQLLIRFAEIENRFERKP